VLVVTSVNLSRKLFAALLIIAVIAPVVSTMEKTEAASQGPRPIEYWVGLSPGQIWDGTIEYFRDHGFTTVVLIATDASPYQHELQKIKQLGMCPILDMEFIIWQGSRLVSVPIDTYQSTFDMWRRAGWTHVASEGGREGDLDYLQKYFTKFTFFNCDRCGIWGNFHMHPLTTSVSWETFFEEEIPYIQEGVRESYPLGKGQGLLAGVWEPNNGCCRLETYKALLDWSYAANVGFTHFHVWFDIGPTLDDYKRLGFETIISELQKYYPATAAAGAPSAISISNVALVPSSPRYLMWEMTYTGSGYAAVAPAAGLFAQTATRPGYAYLGMPKACYVYDVTTGSLGRTTISDGYGWAEVKPGHTYWFFSGPVVPPNAKWAAYNAQAWYYGAYHASIYTNWPYKPLR
jgi:hypothetical protein